MGWIELITIILQVSAGILFLYLFFSENYLYLVSSFLMFVSAIISLYSYFGEKVNVK